MQSIESNVVSIILPAYNTREDFLRDAIDSVVAQTYQHWELLVIDDSTTDPVEKIVKSYNDDRIKYFRNPCNLGMAETRNRGLELATGEFIAFLDHDDIWLPDKLTQQLKVIKSSNCNMVYSPVSFFGDKTWDSVIQHNVTFSELIMKHNIVSCSCVLLRNSMIQKFDLKFSPAAVPADDFSMWLTVALYGGTIECCPHHLIRYRQHSNNVSGTALVCYYPYEWILKNITCKLWHTSRSFSEKIVCTVNILRTRAWVLRKIISEDVNQSRHDKVKMSVKALTLWPLHPKNWLLLIKSIF